MSKNALLFGGFTAWLFVGVFVGHRSAAVDYAAHDAGLRKVARLLAVDADLQRDVLAARYGLLTQYDPLVKGSHELGAVADDVVAGAGDARAVALSRAVRDRRAALEAFKPKNATLTNSLHYLPVAVDAFARDAGAGHKDVVAAAQRLASLTFAAYVARSADATAAVKAAAAEFAAAAVALPPPLDGDGALLARHALRVADDVVVVQPQLVALLAPDVELAAFELRRERMDAFAAQESGARRWRTALWGWSALTFLLAVWVVKKLVALYASLERRVRDRTAELNVKNATLEKKEAQLKDALAQLVELEGMVGAGLQAQTAASAALTALDKGDVAGVRAALAQLEGAGR